MEEETFDSESIMNSTLLKKKMNHHSIRTQNIGEIRTLLGFFLVNSNAMNSNVEETFEF